MLLDLLKEWKLEKYKSIEIIIASEHILNFDEFKMVTKYSGTRYFYCVHWTLE